MTIIDRGGGGGGEGFRVVIVVIVWMLLLLLLLLMVVVMCLAEIEIIRKIVDMIIIAVIIGGCVIAIRSSRCYGSRDNAIIIIRTKGG